MRAKETLVELALQHARVAAQTVWSFVQLSFSDGTTGWGEATVVADHRLLRAPAAAARARILGKGLDDIKRDLASGTVPALPEAAIRSAIEQATLDAEGRMKQLTAAQVLGGSYIRDSVAVYANINRRTTDRSPAGFAASARAAAEDGYATVKIAPFDGVHPEAASSREGHRLIDRGLARVAAVRDALGADAQIYVDCHWRLDAAAAQAVCASLGALKVTWLECPLPEDAANEASLRTLRALASRHGMRLAGLESLTHPAAFEPWFRAGCYDVVMPDVKYAGGISGVMAVGQRARQHGVACAPHNPTGPVCHVASIIAACAEGAMECIEHQYDETPHFNALVAEGLPPVCEGTVRVPSGHGLGLRLDKALLRQLATG